MNISLAGRRAVVCGSTQGIGKAAAIELAKLGAAVTLVARNEEQLRVVAGELPREHGQKHGVVVADFAKAESLAAMMPRLCEGEPHQILVNNTGGPKGGPLVEAGGEELLAAFQMHVIANQMMVQTLVQGMKAAGYGRIINVISTSVKAPIEGLGVSNTIRAAVANWAKTLATELGPFGITVNNVLPGFTQTARLAALFAAKAEKSKRTVAEIEAEAIAAIPARRLGQPEEIAAAIAFLATPGAGYINGVNLPVDGGRTPSL